MKKILKLVSVLMILMGLFSISAGIVLTGLTFLSETSVRPDPNQTLLIFVFSITNGLLEFIGGALGLRTVNNPVRGTDAMVLGFVALVIGVCSLILHFSVQNIFACVVPLVYFICAVDVRKIPESE